MCHLCDMGIEYDANFDTTKEEWFLKREEEEGEEEGEGEEEEEGEGEEEGEEEKEEEKGK